MPKFKIWKDAIQNYQSKDLGYNILSRFYHVYHKKERLKIDMMLSEDVRTYWNGPDLVTEHVPILSRTDMWTEESRAELNNKGYRRAHGFYDSILWWSPFGSFQPYIRIRGDHNAQKLVREARDAKGELIYSQDTAATLHDFMQNKTTEKFTKGMGKTQMQTMDMQKMVMLAILGAGVVFGLYMMGVF